MGKVLITQSKLDTLAEIIGGKSNTNVPMTVDEMITAADSITGGGGSGDGYVWQDGSGYVHLSDEEGTQPIVDSLTVSNSGTYTAPTGHVYNPVIVPSGTAGTPTATKSAVNNHALTVTPSVTNTSGYITGSTINGTAVSVSASELVSGTKSITDNGTGIDVTNYASVDVAVSGGGGTLITKNILTNGTYSASSDNADGYSSVTVNVPNGGASGVVKGTLTVPTTISTTQNVIIADVANDIGFVPTKFLFCKNTDSGTSNAIYRATYSKFDTHYVKSRCIYSGQNATLSGQFNYIDWNTSSSGHLHYDGDYIKIAVSSTNKLEADTYTWWAIQ